MLTYTKDYDESDWRRDADAREIISDRWDKVQMREPEPARACCLKSESFTAHTSLSRDLDTGYLEGSYYQCSCGSIIDEYDYAALVQFENNKVLVIEVTPEQPMETKRVA